MLFIMNNTLFSFDNKNNAYMCQGDWTILELNNILLNLQLSTKPSSENIIINGSLITKFDSAGALTLLQCQAVLADVGNKIIFEEFNQQQLNLLQLVAEKNLN